MPVLRLIRLIERRNSQFPGFLISVRLYPKQHLTSKFYPPSSFRFLSFLRNNCLAISRSALLLSVGVKCNPVWRETPAQHWHNKCQCSLIAWHLTKTWHKEKTRNLYCPIVLSSYHGAQNLQSLFRSLSITRRDAWKALAKGNRTRDNFTVPSTTPSLFPCPSQPIFYC